jgi:anti-sigma B factor antagonist
MSVRRSEASEDVWVVEARGRIDAQRAPDLESRLQMLLAAGHGDVVVDFGKATYISSTGLKVLLVALRAARRQGGDVKLSAMSERVRDVFALSGFDKIFAIYPSESEAASAFGHDQTG